VLITDHLEFKEIDPKKISALMSNKNVVDTRKMLDTQRWKEAGFNVKVLGYG
jgi:UDP-N-acetyl-D-mannosaminuronic acid dehydrogenase